MGQIGSLDKQQQMDLIETKVDPPIGRKLKEAYGQKIATPKHYTEYEGEERCNYCNDEATALKCGNCGGLRCLYCFQEGKCW